MKSERFQKIGRIIENFSEHQCHSTTLRKHRKSGSDRLLQIFARFRCFQRHMKKNPERHSDPDGGRSAPVGARVECPGCAEGFVKTRSNKLFCSRACAKARSARLILEKADAEFIERRRRRKADENARLVERLDQLSADYIETVLRGQKPDDVDRLMEDVLVSARSGGPLRLALLNRRMNGDLPRPSGLQRGRRAYAARIAGRRLKFVAALRHHCSKTRGVPLARYLARPTKVRLTPSRTRRAKNS